MTATAPTGTEVCGAGVWLLATTGPEPLDEYRAYRTHCQSPPGHPGDHTVRVAGEPDDSCAPVQPVTLTWPNPAAERLAPAVVEVIAAELARADVVAGCCDRCSDGRLGGCDRIVAFGVCNDMAFVATRVVDALWAAGWQVVAADQPEATT